MTFVTATPWLKLEANWQVIVTDSAERSVYRMMSMWLMGGLVYRYMTSEVRNI